MKDMFEKINVVDALVVIITGVALVACVVTKQSDAILALGGGLVGYLGGHVAAMK